MSEQTYTTLLALADGEYVVEPKRGMTGEGLGPIACGVIRAHANAWAKQLEAAQERVRELEALLQDARAFAYEAQHMNDDEIRDNGRSLRRRIQRALRATDDASSLHREPPGDSASHPVEEEGT